MHLSRNGQESAEKCWDFLRTVPSLSITPLHAAQWFDCRLWNPKNLQCCQCKTHLTKLTTIGHLTTKELPRIMIYKYIYIYIFCFCKKESHPTISERVCVCVHHCIAPCWLAHALHVWWALALDSPWRLARGLLSTSVRVSKLSFQYNCRTIPFRWLEAIYTPPNLQGAHLLCLSRCFWVLCCPPPCGQEIRTFFLSCVT